MLWNVLGREAEKCERESGDCGGWKRCMRSEYIIRFSDSEKA